MCFIDKSFLLSFALVLLLNPSGLQAQSAKDYYKIAVNYSKEGNHREAIKRFDKAINLESDSERAYVGRAQAYEVLDEFGQAADDWFRAGELSGKDAGYYVNAGENYFKVDSLPACKVALNRAVEIDSKSMEAWQLKTRLHLALYEFVEAHRSASEAMGQKRSLINTYWMAVVSDSLGVYDEAAKYFEEILEGNHLYEDAHVGLVSVKLRNYQRLSSSYKKTEELNSAFEKCNVALEIFPDNNSLYILRSRIHFYKNDFSEAINDISKAIARIPGNEELHLQRGRYYHEFGQYHNAINDYNEVVRLNPNNPLPHYRKGLALESTFENNQALAEFEEALRLSEELDTGNEELYREGRNRILALNRESIVPIIAMHHPEVGSNGLIKIRNDLDTLEINGVINDQSRIKYIRVNGANARFNQNDVNPEFNIKLAVEGLEKIQISTSDWYDNTGAMAFDIIRTETDPPTIAVTKPYASDNGEIQIEAGLQKIAIEGRVKDESLIQSILIDGVSASYAVDELNPAFNAFIDITNKDIFTVSATDEYGNNAKAEFKIIRQDRTIASDNPMGTTWAVFVENTDYQNFASLEGPAKDVAAMKKAFANYEIHKIIHKKNLSKEQLERFFSIELRNMVRENNVNSILVWYAGHGKFISESGYWIPVDAQRDDEFTYFKVNNLKASLESYSDALTHTLVVSDACESGPSFYEAMRGDDHEKHCDNWDYTAFKSSQVLSSAGYELAVQQSVLTDTFVKALLGNDNSCIPIDEVYQKINSEVRKNNQVARFGKIPGLGDENGTFFFIRKQ